MNNLLTPLQGYDIIKFVISLTTLSLLCIPFLRLLTPFRAALQLLFTAYGIIGATAWAAFGTHDVGTNVFLYLAFGGVLAILCVPYTFTLFAGGAIFGGIFFLIGGVIGGFFVCPIIWAKNVFLLLFMAIKGVFLPESGGMRRIIYLILLSLGGVSAGDVVLNLSQVNVFTPITNIIVRKAAPIPPAIEEGDTIINEEHNHITVREEHHHTNINVETLSVLILRADAGSAKYRTATIFGQDMNLAALTAAAAQASFMQFQIAPSKAKSAQSVTWSIRSCNTGDSGLACYLNGQSIEDGKEHTLYSGSSITLKDGDETLSSISVSIELETNTQKQQTRRVRPRPF